VGVLEIVAIVAAVYTLSSLRIIRQYERAVSFFLGRFWNTKGPGLIFLPSLIAHMHRVSLRIVALDIPPQEVITRDNVSLKVNAVLYMKVRDPAAAIIEIENYLYATSQLAQTTLRAVLGQHHLDELLAEREKINETLKAIIDARSDKWGIEVSAVEVKDVDLPKEMQRAMARQAEAERERRAKVINAEGELQASEKLTEAARIIGAQPAAIQLRYLQTVTEIASEKNSTIVFPLPIELLGAFGDIYRRTLAPGAPGAVPSPAALASGAVPALAAGQPGMALPAAGATQAAEPAKRG
jgi:regulator of protease activity HflC (stomatin/prohibitin superfamily)